MFKFTAQALILGRSKDDGIASIDVSLGTDRSSGTGPLPTTAKFNAKPLTFAGCSRDHDNPAATHVVRRQG